MTYWRSYVKWAIANLFWLQRGCQTYSLPYNSFLFYFAWPASEFLCLLLTSIRCVLPCKDLWLALGYYFMSDRHSRSSVSSYEFEAEQSCKREYHQFCRFFTLISLATLSLAVQYPSKSSGVWINGIQVVSWLFLLVTALSLLNDSYVRVADSDSLFKFYLTPKGAMYCFLIGTILQMIVRAIQLFPSACI